MLKKITLAIFISLLCACAGVKKAGVVYHDSFDFSAVKSYSLYERNSPFTETQNLIDTRRNAIEIAIERTMASKKLSYQLIDNADVIVTYHVFNGKRFEYRNYNEMVRFCTRCLRATTWITEQQYPPVKQGSLVVDLVDPKQKRSVWRSVFPLGLKPKENSADTQERIKLAISTMLAEFPQ